MTREPMEKEQKKKGKKRKIEQSTPSEDKKLSKRARREEEKENRSTLRISINNDSESSSSSSSSSISSSRESSNPIRENRRKKTPPVKLDQKTEHESSENYDKIFELILKNGIPTDRSFLTRNVVQKKKLLSKRANCRRNTGATLEKSIETVQKLALKREDLDDLFSANFTKVNCWGSALEAANYFTSSALVQTYTVIVDKLNRVKCLENGMSVVPIGEKSLAETTKITNEKHVKLSKSELDGAKFIYLAVVARRNTIVKKHDQKGGNRRPTRKAAGDLNLTEADSFEPIFRFGCSLMYEDDKINKFDDGIQRIVLVDHEDRPEYLRIFGKNRDAESLTKWMKDAENLEEIDKLSDAKQDSHLARLIFSTESPDFGEEKLKISDKSPKKLKNSTNSAVFPEKIQFEIAVTTAGAPRSIQIHRSSDGFFTCPITKWRFADFSKHSERFISRFPCFRLESIESPHGFNVKIGITEGYFSENQLKFPENWTKFRPNTSRSLKKSKKTPKKLSFDGKIVEETVFSARNRGVDGKKKFGLNFVQSPGHLPFIAYNYKNRTNTELIPEMSENGRSQHSESPVQEEEPEDAQTARKDEFFPINNAQMFTECVGFQKNRPILPEFPHQRGEMKVVEYKPKKEAIASFNRKLSLVDKRFEIKTRKPNPHQPKISKNTAVDKDGRPVPTFSELFFPHGKTELYNILARFYYAEAGHRPGCFSAEWKSRIMTGFIQKYHQEIFEHKLQGLFEKQLQLIALTTPDWKSEHFLLPVKKYRELKKKWRESQKN